MAELQTFVPVTPSEIIQSAEQYAKESYRLIQMHCSATKNNEMFVIYTFEKENLQMVNLKMDVNVGDTISSISGVFFGAFLYENEIHDLYGVNYSGMAVDFQGTFYETAVKHAFAPTVKAETKE